MGSYLEINNRETNSKKWSGILIDAIRDIDTEIMQNENSTEKEKKYFVPEFYDVIEGKKIGCGSWSINKKGMALLVLFLKDMYEDEETARILGIKNNKYYIEHLAKEGIEKEITKFTKEAKKDILWCQNYAVEVLTDMVLNGNKRVLARWV